jgi:predicted dinucleotide-binding enzyme
VLGEQQVVRLREGNDMGISIIGAGNVGMALAHAFTAKGERVVVGTRDPAKHRDAVTSRGHSVSVVAMEAVLAEGDPLVLAVPYAAAADVARSVPDWKNRILVDATNPLAPGLAGLSLGTSTSGAEEIAKAARGARVVKAFNTTGAENLADSRYAGGPVFMPVCGDDAEARLRVIALAALLGFDAVDFGELKAARYLEPFAMCWIHMAVKLGHGRRFAFARMRR